MLYRYPNTHSQQPCREGLCSHFTDKETEICRGRWTSSSPPKAARLTFHCLLRYAVLTGVEYRQSRTTSPSLHGCVRALSCGFRASQRETSSLRTGCCLVALLARTPLDLNLLAQLTPLCAQGFWHPSPDVWAASLECRLWKLARG